MRVEVWAHRAWGQRLQITYSVGLERSSTGRTKVIVVLSCNDKGKKLALKQVQQYADTADLY